MAVEHPDLSGFVRYHGVPLCPIGDDGDFVVALGHPTPMQAVAAFNRHARVEMGLVNMLDRHGGGTLEDAVAELEWKWARLCTTADCDERDADEPHICEMCTHIADGGWWLRWSAVETPESFPVVVWST